MHGREERKLNNDCSNTYTKQASSSSSSRRRGASIFEPPPSPQPPQHAVRQPRALRRSPPRRRAQSGLLCRLAQPANPSPVWRRMPPVRQPCWLQAGAGSRRFFASTSLRRRRHRVLRS
ncbi:hypothetical protein HPB50_014745 [Hyalomma asiaticum]|uniref:Uncharacterized protein n=1 Tax=Hyalomma asiaticum TaxID=266040 RepID=A0ACB7SCX1_HYAAI|nr:hypothetical protein HPB50_014745 [Hyalomma asiaticum]